MLVACTSVAPAEMVMDGSDVEAVILGIAQDGGVPQIGDHCKNCQAARGDRDRRHFVASLGLIDRQAKKAYMIDATPHFTDQWDRLLEVAGFPERGTRTAPDGIFLTHAHMGHYTGLAQLGREAFGARRVPVHATEAMGRFLSANAPWEMLVRLENIKLMPLKPGEQTILRDGLSVTAISSPHRHEYSDTMGYIVEGKRRLLYLPDTDAWEKWDRPIEEICREMDYALLDGTFYSRTEVPGRDIADIPHPLVTYSMDRLEKIAMERPGSIIFIHLNHTNPLLDPDGQERKDLEQRGFRVGREGMRIPL